MFMDDTTTILAEEFDTSFTKEADIPTASDADEKKTSLFSKVPNTHKILVNQKQRGNPLLKFITNVPWEYEDITPDYQMGKTVCALFLSLRYHTLNPDYIHDRLKLLGKMYELRILLVLIDVKDYNHSLKHLTRICLLANMMLMVARSSEEAGKIVETYKIYETKPPDNLKGKSVEAQYLKIIEALTSIESINNTDAMLLLQQFHTLEGIINATEYQLSQCPGFGGSKARKLYSALQADFCL